MPVKTSSVRKRSFDWAATSSAEHKSEAVTDDEDTDNDDHGSVTAGHGKRRKLSPSKPRSTSKMPGPSREEGGGGKSSSSSGQSPAEVDDDEEDDEDVLEKPSSNGDRKSGALLPLRSQSKLPVAPESEAAEIDATMTSSAAALFGILDRRNTAMFAQLAVVEKKLLDSVKTLVELKTTTDQEIAQLQASVEALEAASAVSHDQEREHLERIAKLEETSNLQRLTAEQVAGQMEEKIAELELDLAVKEERFARMRREKHEEWSSVFTRLRKAEQEREEAITRLNELCNRMNRVEEMNGNSGLD